MVGQCINSFPYNIYCRSSLISQKAADTRINQIMKAMWIYRSIFHNCKYDQALNYRKGNDNKCDTFLLHIFLHSSNNAEFISSSIHQRCVHDDQLFLCVDHGHEHPSNVEDPCENKLWLVWNIDFISWRKLFP